MNIILLIFMITGEKNLEKSWKVIWQKVKSPAFFIPIPITLHGFASMRRNWACYRY
jgi:hypothetical protein